MKTVILGAGSIGIIIGALMTKNGADVILVDANRENVAALNAKGARITGHMNVTVPVKAITPEEMSGMYDIVFYAVKQADNEAALTALLPHLHENSVVATMQNGVPEATVAGYVGEKRVVGCPVGWGATWVEPGVSELTSDLAKMTISLSAPGPIAHEVIDAVEEKLALVCEVERIKNLIGIRWTKLIFNASMSGIAALIGGTIGEILDNDKALTCVAYLGNEGIMVADAAKINLERMQGADINMMTFKTADDLAFCKDVYRHALAPHRRLRAGMLQDLEKGIRTEIDAINGVICQTGRSCGVPTPFNDIVIGTVYDLEAAKIRPDIALLERFQLPDLPAK